MTLKDLQSGRFPEDGDHSWRDNLEGAIISWIGKPAAPPMASLRPLLVEVEAQKASGA